MVVEDVRLPCVPVITRLKIPVVAPNAVVRVTGVELPLVDPNVAVVPVGSP
jgi:hypothetical protein